MKAENEGLSEGVWVEEINNAALDEFERNQSAYKNGFVKIMPHAAVFPRGFASCEQTIQEFEVREDDVFVASFPKCGTTWTQEMVWNIVNDLDFEKAKSVPQEERMPFIEISALIKDAMSGKLSLSCTSCHSCHAMSGVPDSLDAANNMPHSEPRVLKTHFCYDMLPKQVRDKKPKIIYVTRNPRDAVVSFCNHWKVLCGYTGKLIRRYYCGDVVLLCCRNTQVN